MKFVCDREASGGDDLSAIKLARDIATKIEVGTHNAISGTIKGLTMIRDEQVGC